MQRPERRHDLGKAFSAAALVRRRVADHAARFVITLGGIAVILSIFAILYFIAAEVWPLANKASVRIEASHPVGSAARILATGTDEYRSLGYSLTDDGMLSFVSLADGSAVHSRALVTGRTLTSATASIDARSLSVGTDSGEVFPVHISYESSLDEDLARTVTPEVEVGEPIALADGPIAEAYIGEGEDGGMAVAARTGDGRILYLSRSVTRSFLGGESIEESTYDLTASLGGETPTALALDGLRENMYVGTDGGAIIHFTTADGGEPELVERIPGGAPITALGLLLGDRSVLVGDAEGGVAVWFQTEDAASPTGHALRRAHVMEPHESAVRLFAANKRNRGFASADTGGHLRLYHATTERMLADVALPGGPADAIALAPRADGVVAAGGGGMLLSLAVEDRHPEATIGTLFGKVWYEGYPGPAYVWQSAGFGDDFEPKLSLVPLLFGTVKGTLYALLFSLPLAILGALSASQFMHPSLRGTIKPVIEIMAALPSVVLGFLGGLWLAPVIEGRMPTLLLMPPVLVAITLLGLFAWNRVPATLRKRVREGSEVLLLIPLYLLGIKLCLVLGGPIEASLLGGDFRAWLHGAFGLGYDQRNSLVVGFAMGFAVIPIIFTIAEDAMSNVPRHLISGSLALGATRWETAIRVVLPTASAGIFSAIMIGLGRAVGETMIVLMATGNTPIMDWNVFAGFRALSANIAVEISEAPQGETLYRVLFLAALLLFALTFTLNTAAEVVRSRLRKKYGRL